MAIKGYSVTPAAEEESTATTANVNALINKVNQIDKLLNHQLENHITGDDIETEDIMHNTER